MSGESKHTNRLIHETSPYLLQHAHNPVDWYPWGEEALARARAENRPILLSIGYSACHWCHVMEHESFENEPIARLMNEHFINIKVDREERPDLDTIYMNAVQMMTGHGGWPMTVFLTPDGRPFYGGTYYPPVDRHGMPGFPRLLISIAEAWQTRRQEIEKNAGGLLQELQRIDRFKGAGEEATRAVLDQSAARLLQSLDRTHGGFGTRPKFPPAMALSFLLRQELHQPGLGCLDSVTLTLDRMARGGIYDQLGGGFHRYSVDERWLVPHFEKMLYDNALLSRVYLEAWLVTGNPFYRQIVEETLAYVCREMTDPSGAFYSTQDADSEGVEGKFFVWHPAEVYSLLGPEEGEIFCRYYDITEEGNFEEANILHVEETVEPFAARMGRSQEEVTALLARGRQILFQAREGRVKPGRDEKILTAWNGLMLRSFAEAARALNREDYLAVAIRNADFLLTQMREGDRLRRTHHQGQTKLNGYLEDYANTIDGLLALYHASFDARWFEEALRLTEAMIRYFHDEEGGGFFFTSHDHETLIARSKDFYDNATPSGNAVAADLLLRLARYTGESRYQDLAEEIFRQVAAVIPRMPTGFGHLLSAIDLALATPSEVAVIGPRTAPQTEQLLAVLREQFLPHLVVAFADSSTVGDVGASIPLLANRPLLDGQPTAYLCRNHACERPTTDPQILRQQLARSSNPRPARAGEVE
jgi:uncharacterized protein YyaL (SSP411 family)